MGNQLENVREKQRELGWQKKIKADELASVKRKIEELEKGRGTREETRKNNKEHIKNLEIETMQNGRSCHLTACLTCSPITSNQNLFIDGKYNSSSKLSYRLASHF